MQQPAMSKRSRKLNEQWLFMVADVDGRTRFISNGLPGDAPDMEEPMQSTRMKKLVKAALVDDEVGRPRLLAAGNHSNNRREGDPVFSSSRSWRSCNEEVIKKVIRESLLLNSDGHKAASSRSLGSYLRGGFDLPNYEGEMKKNSVTALDQPVKMKAPSLIARLMGLESVPAGATGPTAEPKSSRDQNPNAARLMLHFQKPERVTLRSIIEREKIERLTRTSEQDCGDQLSFSDNLVNEHAPSVAEVMQKPSWKRGEEKEDFNSCECSAQQPAELAKLEHEEIITMSNRRKSEDELERTEVRMMRKTKLEPSKNSKMPASARHGQQQNEAAKAFKKVDRSRRPGFGRDHLQSRKDVKASAASLSPSKKNATGSAEPQRRADTAKRILFKKIERKLAFRNSTTPPVEKKDKGGKSAQKMTKSKMTEQKDGEDISPSCKPEDAPVINTSPAAESRQQKQLISTSSINEQTKRDLKMICEIMPMANKAAAAAVELVDNDIIDTKREDKVEYLESLLLGCQSFLLALGDADTCTHHETRDTNKIDKDVKPYMSCAEELILRKRYHQQLLSHPLLLKCCSWRSAEHEQPLDQLVGEISKGIRRLASYSEVDHEVSSRDSLYVRLERDLKCKDMVLDAVWDVDWRNAICVEEADHVAGQLEEHVLSALVEDFAMELVNDRC